MDIDFDTLGDYLGTQFRDIVRQIWIDGYMAGKQDAMSEVNFNQNGNPNA